MADETKITIKDCLSGAFQALLKGELAERDRLCALAERTFNNNGNKDLPGDADVMTKGKLQ